MMDLSTIEARLALATKHAAKYGLKPTLVAAVCEQESSWNPWAMRYEPMFYDRYVQSLLNSGVVKTLTEATARSTSWGLMQTMGQSVREIGFNARFLSSLCDPDTSLEWGCKLLKHKLDAAGDVVVAALLLWNGGGNHGYPSEVIARIPTYEAVRLV